MPEQRSGSHVQAGARKDLKRDKEGSISEWRRSASFQASESHKVCESRQYLRKWETTMEWKPIKWEVSIRNMTGDPDSQKQFCNAMRVRASAAAWPWQWCEGEDSYLLNFDNFSNVISSQGMMWGMGTLKGKTNQSDENQCFGKYLHFPSAFQIQLQADYSW